MKKKDLKKLRIAAGPASAMFANHSTAEIAAEIERRKKAQESPQTNKTMNKLQTTLDEAVKALAIDTRFPLPQRLEMIGAMSAMQEGFKESLKLPEGDPGKLTPEQLDLMAEDYEAIKAIMMRREPQVSIGTLALCMTLYGLELAYSAVEEGADPDELETILDNIMPGQPSTDSGERVLVATVPWLAHVFGGASLPQGFINGSETTLAGVLEESHFQPRAKMETDTFYKQLIPYCIVLDEHNQVLTYTRGKAGQEDRLHDKLSMAFGGHVNPLDSIDPEFNTLNIVHSCVRREVEEELGLNILEHPIKPVFAGFVNNDADAVGAVHLGLVYLIRIRNEWVDLAKVEQAVVRPRWRPVSHLLPGGLAVTFVNDGAGDEGQNTSRLEEWSRLIVEPLFGTRKRAIDDGVFPQD
jgi:predicted NUDIX family phosphoesterase